MAPEVLDPAVPSGWWSTVESLELSLVVDVIVVVVVVVVGVGVGVGVSVGVGKGVMVGLSRFRGTLAGERGGRTDAIADNV